jgi:hypothetical protein
LSITCVSRSRCKYCCSPPVQDLYGKSKKDFLDPRKWSDFTYRKAKCFFIDDYYKFFDPKEFSSIDSFSITNYFKSFSPVFHSKKINKAFKVTSYSGSTMYLVCECGRTIWNVNTSDIFGAMVNNSKRAEKTY